MKNLAKGALIAIVVLFAVVGVLSLLGCHDSRPDREFSCALETRVTCDDWDGKEAARDYTMPVPLDQMCEDRVHAVGHVRPLLLPLPGRGMVLVQIAGVHGGPL